MGKYVPCSTMCFVATWATVTTRTNDCKKTGRNRIPDRKLLAKFHTIDIAPVYTGARPNPISQGA